MAAVAPQVFDAVNDYGNRVVYDGTDGTNDNDIIIETGDVSKFDTFMLSHALGAADVEVYDGAQWLTAAPLSIEDLGSASVNPVTATVPLRQYRFTGNYSKIRVRQDGAVATTGVVLRAARTGR